MALKPDFNMEGMVLDIERFAIHDGPGIRTVVFLKGCPLKCLWCSTPDGQSCSPEIEYFAHKCIKCGKCIEICPAGATTKSKTGEIIINRRKCTACGRCEACLEDARKIVGKKMTVAQVGNEIKKDILFYRNSGGGVTLSGGEPMMQPKFSLEILRMCMYMGIHTCMETSAYVKWTVLDEVLAYVDLLYVDIKHMSAQAHSRLTGKSNKIILQNVVNIAEKYPRKKVVVRVPIVPGCNDDAENIRATALFIRNLRVDWRIELLPYHKLGVHRYDALSRKYLLRATEPPSDAQMRLLEKLVKSLNVQVISQNHFALQRHDT